MMKVRLMIGTALSIVLVSSLATSSNAQFSYHSKAKIRTHSVTINGALAGNTKPTCSDLEVKILEIRQIGEQQSGQLFPPTRTTTLARGLAEEDGTQCKYSLTYEQPLRFAKLSEQQEQYWFDRTIAIQVRGGYGWHGDYSYQPKGDLPEQQAIDITIGQLKYPG